MRLAALNFFQRQAVTPVRFPQIQNGIFCRPDSPRCTNLVSVSEQRDNVIFKIEICRTGLLDVLCDRNDKFQGIFRTDSARLMVSRALSKVVGSFSDAPSPPALI